MSTEVNKTETQAPKPTAQIVAGPTDSVKGSYLTTNEQEDADIANASRTRLAELEDALKEYLNDIGQPTLAKTVEDESSYVKKTGIGTLSKIDKNQTGLESYQAKTKKSIDDKLTADQVQADQKAEAMKQLAAIHKMRANLMEKEIRQEDNDRMGTAFRALMGRLGVSPGTVAAYESGSVPKSQLLEMLSANTPPEISGNGFTIHYDGNTITCNDPETLGLAAAAAGYKKVTFSGAPQQVLTAAMAALANGVENVAFDKQTIKNIRNPNAYKSYHEYLEAQKKLEAIQNRCTAIQTARDHKINNVFNDPKDQLSDTAKIFLNMPSSRRGHLEFLESLSPEDRASLAVELKDVPMHIGTGPAIKGDDYVHELFKNLKPTNGSPIELERFKESERQYNAQYSKELVEKLRPQITKDIDPLAVAQHIGSSRHVELRTAFCEDIQNYKPFGTETENRNYQNQVRASVLSQLIDRVTTSSIDEKGNLKLKGEQKLEPELGALLAGTTEEDRDQIKDLLKQYDRVTPKLKNHLGHQYPHLDWSNPQNRDMYISPNRKDKKEMALFATKEEGRGAPDVILTNLNRYQKYNDSFTSVDHSMTAMNQIEQQAAQSKLLGKQDVLVIDNDPQELNSGELPKYQ